MISIHAIMHTICNKRGRIPESARRLLAVACLAAVGTGAHAGMMGGGMMGGGMMRGGMMGMHGSAQPSADAAHSNTGTRAGTGKGKSTSTGKALYSRVCGSCHQVPDPAAHTADQWPQVVQRMQAHMQQSGQADLDDQQVKAILQYLRKHASH